MADSEFPLQIGTLSNPDPKFWGYSGVKYTKELSKLFVIGLFDLQEQDFITYKEPFNGTAANIKKYGAAYYFTTPPQTYEISEQASVQIVPTQDGGKFVESQGSIFKDIRLTGTVGFRPNPETNELFPGLEEAGGPSIRIPSFVSEFTNDDRGLNPKEVTGFDEIIYLRNMFRAYWDIKSDPEWSNRTVMIFANGKESEIWLVEPINFTTSRDKSSPLSWRYSISLKTLFKWDQTVPLVQDTLKWYQSVSNVIQTIRKVSQSISDSLHTIANLVTYVANLPANLLNSVLSIGSDILTGLAAVKNAGANFGSTITETMLNTIRNNSNELKRLFDDKYMSLGSDSLMSGDIGELRHAFVVLTKSAEVLLAADTLWSRPKQIQISDYNKAYTDEFGNPPFNSGSPLNVANLKIPESAVEVIVNNLDIRAIAKQYLGDEARWKLLVIMNNLRPPYLSVTASDGVLAPGDKILVPKHQSIERSQVSRAINTDQAIEAQSSVVRKYGRDIRISNIGTHTEVADLQVSQRGDIDVIEGVSNVEQAMMIKFSTEQGELPLHPDFGAKYPLGTKIGISRIQEFAMSTRKTLLSDPRVDSITSLKISTDSGDRLYTSSKIKLKDANKELPINFVTRR